MNRTLIRGVTAGIAAASMLGGATVAGSTIAAAMTPPAHHAPPPPLAVAPTDLHRVGGQLHTVFAIEARRDRARKARASRSSFRAVLNGSPQTAAHALLLRNGWGETQWGCLDALWTRESNWDIHASNGGSGAYGIPQALPADKMSMMGSDWRSDAITQIRWGLWYIGQTYGSPCNAYDHSNSYGYY